MSEKHHKPAIQSDLATIFEIEQEGRAKKWKTDEDERDEIGGEAERLSSKTTSV